MKFFIRFSIFALIIGCSFHGKQKIGSPKRMDYSCNKCDSIIGETSLFNYRKRWVIDEFIATDETIDTITMQITGWTVCGERIATYIPDSVRVFTDKEVRQMKGYRYCFIGKTKYEILKQISSEKVWVMKNGIAFLFKEGGIKNGCFTNDCECKLKQWKENLSNDESGCIFSITSESIILFEGFSKEGVYIGVKKDSFHLDNCLKGIRNSNFEY